MAHELIRLRESLVNTPHLVCPTTFKTVTDYLDARNTNPSMFDEDDDEPSQGSNGRYSYNEDSQVALLNIDGPLTYRPVKMLCGGSSGTNYQTLKEDFAYLAESGAKTIALYANSGGGMAYQMFSTAKYMRKVADEYGIKIIAMVDGLAASACYGLICIADEIVMAEGAEVGSIGVLIQLFNDSRALDKAGYERTFVSAGKNKIPFDKDGAFTESFISGLQERVNELYAEFTSFVADHRGLTQDQVIDTNADTFTPSKAIQLGLADKVMSVEEFFDYLADEAESNMNGDNSLFGKNKLFNKTANAELPAKALTNEVNEEMELKELQAQLETVQKELVAGQEAFAALTEAHTLFTAKAAEEKAALEAAVAQAQELVASLEADKVQTKLDSRKEQLSKFVPAETAAELTSTFAALDDASFEVVLKSYSLKHVKESNSEMLEELGEHGEPDASQSESMVDKIKQSTRQHITK